MTPPEGRLTVESVALCHQMRVVDETRLQSKLGKISELTMAEVEICVGWTLGIRAV